MKGGVSEMFEKKSAGGEVVYLFAKQMSAAPSVQRRLDGSKV